MPHVQSAHGDGFGASLVIAYSANVVAGNNLRFGSSCRADLTTVSDSLGQTWVKAIDRANSGLTTFSDIWHVENCSGGANSVTISGGGTVNRAMAVAEYSGVLTSGSLDQTATGAAFSTAVDTAATGTTTAAAEELFAVIGNEGARTAVWDAPWAERQDGGAGASCSIADQTVSATGAYTAGGDINSIGEWTACIATFKLTPPVVQSGAQRSGYTWFRTARRRFAPP